LQGILQEMDDVWLSFIAVSMSGSLSRKRMGGLIALLMKLIILKVCS
jgi:hypothetical protein